jgi:hypothetical protein
MGECTKRSERQPVFISADALEVGGSGTKRRGGLRGGRLARSGNAKPERAGAIPKQFAPNPSGAGTPKVEARLPSDCLPNIFGLNSDFDYQINIFII